MGNQQNLSSTNRIKKQSTSPPGDGGGETVGTNPPPSVNHVQLAEMCMDFLGVGSGCLPFNKRKALGMYIEANGCNGFAQAAAEAMCDGGEVDWDDEVVLDSHDLFNSTVFSIQDYRQQLENLILNDYDWNNEGAVFVNNAVSTFGTNWKQEVAKAVSWIGLENTDEYSTYLNSYSTQPMKFLYINDIRNIISVTNNNCP